MTQEVSCGCDLANCNTARALGRAHQGGRAKPEMLAKRRQVRDVPSGRGQSRRQTEASTIQSNDAKASAQRRCLRLPHIEIERPAMHEEHRASSSLVAIAQFCTAGLEVEIRSRWVHNNITLFSNSEKDFAFRLRASGCGRQVTPCNLHPRIRGWR